LHRFAAIAQLVEHVIRNDGVTGSSPVCGTTPVQTLHRFLRDLGGCAEQLLFGTCSEAD
jgi:hypothetical protein